MKVVSNVKLSHLVNGILTMHYCSCSKSLSLSDPLMGRKQMGPFHFQERKIKMKNSRRRKEKSSKVGLPDAVQYKARWEDSHVDVGYDYVMKVAFSFIREEKIWHPYFARIVEGQIFHTTCAINKQMEISIKKKKKKFKNFAFRVFGKGRTCSC